MMCCVGFVPALSGAVSEPAAHCMYLILNQMVPGVFPSIVVPNAAGDGDRVGEDEMVRQGSWGV